MTEDLKKTYIVASEDYFGVQPTMYKFQGTFRELLNHLTGLEDEEEEDFDGRKASEYTDEEVLKQFNDGNGDGSSYVMVYCLDDDKQVIG